MMVHDMKRQKSRGAGFARPLRPAARGFQGIGFLCLVLQLFLTGPLFAADWPMFRGNAQNTGRAEGSFPLKPDILWSFRAEDSIESTAAIVGDSVYTASLDGQVYGLNFKDGKLKWTYKTGDEIKSSPAVWGDMVYIGDQAGFLHALNRHTGKLLWKFETEGDVVSSCLFEKGMVIFGSYDAKIYALDAKTGKKKWEMETDGYIHGTPALAGNELVISGCDATMRILNVDSGKQRGEPIEMDGYVASSPLVLNGRAYMGTFENQVRCVDVATQKILWQYEYTERQFPYYSSPATTGEILIIGGRDKILHAIDMKTGKSKWTFTTRSKIDSSPVVIGDRVIFGDMAGKLYQLTHADGKKVWEYDTGDSVIASPAISDGKMVIGLDNGLVLCMGKK